MGLLARSAGPKLPRVVCCVVLLLITFTARPAFALYEHVRTGWVAGIGFGWAKAHITTGDSVRIRSPWQDGSAPHFRLGHMLGRHAMLGYEQFQWLQELAVADSAVRVNMQTFGAAITIFPGDPKRVSGGIYLRAGAGLTNARIAFVSSVQDSTEREEHDFDESGTAFMVGGGYEFRISKPAALTFDVTANYHTVGKYFIDKAWFVPMTLGLNWYF